MNTTKEKILESLEGWITLKVVWLYTGNPKNWGGKKEMEKGVGGKITCEYDDGYVELECEREFKVKNIEEAKEIMKDNKLNLVGLEVFTVFKDKQIIFTS